MIVLLPALPHVLSSGYMRNIRARGDMSVSMVWKKGEVAAGVLTAHSAHHWNSRNGVTVDIDVRSTSAIKVVGQWLVDERRTQSELTCAQISKQAKRPLSSLRDYTIHLSFFSFPCNVVICDVTQSVDECAYDISSTLF